MRKIYVLLVMNFFLCLCALRAQNAESWNLVWREDFGVAEDTLIKNFADKSNSVPGHCFIDDERFCNGQIVWDAASNSNICDGFYDCRPKTSGASGCGSIDDGFYGITSNTWWAYNRWASCKNNAGHFVAGKDHTGNKNGAMLVINSGVGEGDAIFSKKIEFNLCDSREYRFVIYVASITAYGNDDPAEASGGNADLEMNVINTTTGKVVETIRTGAIPFWKAEGWGDAGGGIADTKADRIWSEYSCEFIANDGDVLELQVTNWVVAITTLQSMIFLFIERILKRCRTLSSLLIPLHLHQQLLTGVFLWRLLKSLMMCFRHGKRFMTMSIFYGRNLRMMASLGRMF
jgi:hypothetical protein